MTKLVISISEFQSQVADLLPSNYHKKSRLTTSLINSYSLLDGFDYIITKSVCSKDDLLKFHSSDYVEALLDDQLNREITQAEDESILYQMNSLAAAWAASRLDETENKRRFFKNTSQLYAYFQEIPLNKNSSSRKRSYWDTLIQEEYENDTNKSKPTKRDLPKLFNLEGDCPLFSYLPMYCQVIAGATLMLADYINKTERTIALNWDGGRHHAFKGKASGFCYVNDIVLIMQKLRRNGFQKMTYIDFDLHHGDGVEKAFQFSSNVQTISLHMYEPGFFPCTGSLGDTKKGKSIVNVPLLHGVDDEYYRTLMGTIIIPLMKKHKPEILIIQCGGDGLIGDRFEEWQLTIKGLSERVTDLIQQFPNCSIVLLGGGGYNETVMSRFHTYLTWRIIELTGHDILLPECFNFDNDELIPEHEFTEFYSDEQFKFWAYELEGSLKRKELRNDNGLEYVRTLKKFYEIVDEGEKSETN